jgi:putative multicomponent Na+:H+ antiporter subunit B
MTDSYIYIIIALLPLTACMLVFQVNPYHALVIRGILGAVAALVYAVLGAADVALTEALVGTMLAITLYVVAVRSSLVMRLGILKDGTSEGSESLQDDGKAGCDFEELIDNLRTTISKYHLRLELVTYPDRQALNQGLIEKKIHATLTKSEIWERDDQKHTVGEDERQPYQTAIGVRRLYEIMQSELSSSQTILTYVGAAKAQEKH